jgi:hypothetical protein
MQTACEVSLSSTHDKCMQYTSSQGTLQVALSLTCVEVGEDEHSSPPRHLALALNLHSRNLGPM